SENRTRLRFAPIGGGAGRELPDSGLEYQWARLFPAGDRLLALAHHPGEPLRLYVQTIATGKAEPLTGALMVRNVAISPDGERVAVLTPEGKLTIYPVRGGNPSIISAESLAPIRWSKDGRWLFVQHLRSSVQAASDVSRIDPATGEIQVWKKV